VCCSVLQCVAVCCSVWQCIGLLPWKYVCSYRCAHVYSGAVCCSVLQGVAVCGSVLDCSRGGTYVRIGAHTFIVVAVN